MAEFLGNFIHGYDGALAMSALGIPVKSVDVDVVVVSDDFTNHRKYQSDEVDGKRLMVVPTSGTQKPFTVQIPLADDNGEVNTFDKCQLKMLGKAKLTGVTAFINAQRNQISFKAKSIEGVK